MMHRFLVLALGLSLYVPTASAGEREEAEMGRFVNDLYAFHERKMWTGVERRYADIMELEGVVVPYDVHLTAAHSSRALGDVGATLERLERAGAQRQSDEVSSWVRDINNNYARVELLIVPPRSVALSAETMPFAPDQRLAVEVAVDSMEEDGVFFGMLPHGNYELAGRKFEVVEGVTTRVELSAKEIRAEKKRQAAGSD